MAQVKKSNSKSKKAAPKKVVSKKPIAKGKKPVFKKAAAKKPILKAKPAAKTKLVKKTVAVKPVIKKTVQQAVVAPKRPAGLPEQLRDAALKVLEERQADDIFVVDLYGRSSIADYLIVASGRAARQLAAIAHYLGEEFEKLGIQRVRTEGLPEANWVLIDGGDVIVHLFLPEVRGFYKLEEIWGKSQKA